MEKRVTIYDIAKKAGVSVGTVNRALNDKDRISPITKKLVLDTAKSLGYKANVAAQGLRRSPITIGAILFCPVEEYVDSIISGISSSASDLEKYNVTVDIKKIPYTNSEESLKKAYDKIKSFSKKGYQGIILFLSSTIEQMRDVKELIQNLTEKNIYFATVANDIPGSPRVLHVGIDAYVAGKMAAEILEISCPKKDVALLVASEDSPINMAYINGFNNYKKDDTFSSVKIYEHYDDKDKIIDVTKKMLKDNPSLSGIYMSTASSGIAVEYIKKQGKNNLFIITTDLLKDTPKLLKEKFANATIFQNPYRQGRNVVKLLYNYILNKSDQGVHEIPPQILLSSNVDDYLDETNL